MFRSHQSPGPEDFLLHFPLKALQFHILLWIYTVISLSSRLYKEWSLGQRIFVYLLWCCFFANGCPMALAPFVEKLILLMKWIIHLCQNSVSHTGRGLLLGPPFSSAHLYLFLHHQHMVSRCSILIPPILFPFKTVLALLVPLHFRIDFRIILSISIK